jgi:hypothetical protein
VRGKAQSCLNRLKTGEHSKTSHAKAQRREGAKETIQLVSVEFRAFVPWRLGVRCLLFHTFEAGSAKKTKHLNLRAVERAK